MTNLMVILSMLLARSSAPQTGYMPSTPDQGPAPFSMPYDPPNYNSPSQLQMTRAAPIIPVGKKEKVIHSCSYCGLVLSSG